MKILVIGNGLLATSIIERLEIEGHELLVYSRRFGGGIRSRQVVGDIFDFESFVENLSWRPQVIIQTAWITTHGIYTNDPSNFRYAQFTSDLARFITETDVEHLIVLGSCAEYGPQVGPSTAGITKLNPNNLYAEQKVVAFNSTKNSLFGSEVRLTWARIFQPYGLGQDKRRLLPLLISELRNGEEVHLTNTSSILDWITTRDVASAISWIINYDTPIEVDIGTSIGVTNIELLKLLEGLLGNTTQWIGIAGQNSFTQDVAIAGKNSPLFKSGWLPSDSLKSGLEWVLGL